MTPDDVIELFVAGIILVIGAFVVATISAPSIASILDNIIVEVISGLVYVMVVFVIIAMFYQLFKNI
ncbi:hypothetical protein ACFQAS_14460 [Halopenitus salinus]|uniref:Uncharacterized protein n=1 Tax=Halopenitus salinus TaxID=1198295 RepID=A0ABD5UWV6_9EURY